MKSHPLKRERQARNWSLSKLAEILDTNVRTISRWENGQAIPSPTYRERLCLLFEKNARELGILPDSTEKSIQAETPRAAPLFQSKILKHSPLLVDPQIPDITERASSLLGREALLAQVKHRLLHNNRAALTALNGLPGVGKTALAVALATDQEIQARFRDGILWVGLGPRPNVHTLLTRWCMLLTIPHSLATNANDREVLGKALHTVISSRRMLLVIDDAWILEDALAFQVGGGQCAHLLTTRQPQLAYAFAQDGTFLVPELNETDGLALLARFIPQMVEQDPDGARALVQSVGSLPLALVLMGKYLATQTHSKQPHQLQAVLSTLQRTEQQLREHKPPSYEPLAEEQANPLPLSPLYAAVAMSVEQLSTQARHVLGTLTVFPPKPNTFSEEAALIVSQAEVETLDELWDIGLLESNGPGRYMLHQVVASYAHAQSIDSESQRRFVRYMLHYLLEHVHNYEQLEPELKNIYAAFDVSLALEMQQEVVQSITSLVSIMRTQGLYNQADQYLRSALQAALEIANPGGQIAILHDLATFAELRGDYTQVLHYAQRALMLARQHHLFADISSILTLLGSGFFHCGKHQPASTSFTEGLRLARKEENHQRASILLAYLSRIARYQGQYARAEIYAQEGLVLARQADSQETVSQLLLSLAALSVRRGNYDQAEQHALEGLVLARRLGQHEQLGILLSTLGCIATHQGNFALAEGYFQEGLTLARRAGRRAQICDLLTNAGVLAIKRAEYAQAERYLDEGLQLARQLKLSPLLPFLLMHFGQVEGLLRKFNQALTYLQEGLEIARQLDATWLICDILINQGEVYLKNQQLDNASKAFHLAITTDAGKEHDLRWTAIALYGLSRIAVLQGNRAEAYRLGRESLNLASALPPDRSEEIKRWQQSFSEQEDILYDAPPVES